MRRFPKPFFRPSRKLWYVQVNGKQINLGPDRDRAFEQYHALMGARASSTPSIRAAAVLVVEILDAFLEHCQIQNSPATYQWYRDRLQEFAPTIPRSLTVSELRPFHVQQWVDSHSRWSNGTRRIAIRSIKRALHWAEEQGLIDKSPIAKMRKPAGGRRELVVSPEEFRTILERTRNREFRDLLIVTWETGCRPQESLRVEARHVDIVNKRWVFPQSEGKTGLRVIYLTERALRITLQLMSRHPSGKLFRNSGGHPWTTAAVNCAFRAVRQRIGKERMRGLGTKLASREVRQLMNTLRRKKVEKGRTRPKTEGELLGEACRKLWQKKACALIPKYSLYALRHSWATHALQRGVDPLTVAILLGHSDPSMLAKVYQHLSLNPTLLRSQLERAVG